MNPYLTSWLRFNDANDIAKDECGNKWTTSGSPTITTDNAILGTAGYFAVGAAGKSLICTQPLISGGQDFSFDVYVTGMYANNGMCPVQLLFTSSSSPSPLVQLRYLGRSPNMRFYSDSDAYNAKPAAYGTRYHYAASYVHNASTIYFFMDGVLAFTFPVSVDASTAEIRVGNISSATSTDSALIIDEFRIFDGIALWTEPFTPPTTEADYDLTECPFSVFMPATRSIVKPADESADVKRTVDKTADESADLASRVVRSENIFSNVNRTVDKSADEFANVKRTVNFSAVNDFSTIRRTVNVDDNFANVKLSTVSTAENFSPTKRAVVFSDECDLQPQRRLTNLADEFAQLRRLVHEPQVVDIYTRRRLTNLDDNFADTQRKILATSGNVADLNRAVIFTTNNFSATKRTVNKTATESANVKRQILFSAENDLPSVRRVINVDENFANVTSNIIKTTDIFAPTLRETLRSEICFVETSRRAELLAVIVALKSQQGNVLGYIRFQKDKTSSIGHLVTHFNGLNFYAGLVEVDEPTASSFRVRAYGMVYALKEEFL